MKIKRVTPLNGEQISPIDEEVVALWRTFGYEFSQLSKRIVYYEMAVKPYQDRLNNSAVKNVMIVEIQTATSFKADSPCSRLTIVFSYTLKG